MGKTFKDLKKIKAKENESIDSKQMKKNKKLLKIKRKLKTNSLD